MQPAALVEQAWTATLPEARFDWTQSWADAGGDSLKMLTLVLHLERLGELTFPYDRLYADMTPAELAGVVATIDTHPPTSPAAEVATLYLVPGVLGGTVKIAQFARQIADRLKVEVVAPPDLDSSAQTLLSVERTAAAISQAVRDRQPDGPVHLGGYCFGGVLAFEAARQLQREGRKVASLAVIDGLLPSPTMEAALADPERASAATRFQGLMTRDLSTWYGYGGAPGWKRRLLNFAFRRRWYRLLRIIAKLAAQRRRDGHWLAEALLHRLRGIAWTTYRPPAADMPVHVFITEEMRAEAGVDLGWARWCPVLSVSRLAGRHLDVFEHDPDSGLGPLLLDHVQSAGRQA